MAMGWFQRAGHGRPQGGQEGALAPLSQPK